MDIRTLEMKTGLARANIRFYEKEGLITPNRKENGYRDYSEADYKNIMRIVLLRRLRFSIEEIRELQQQDPDLEKILSGKIRELEAEQRAIMAAMEVCRRMQMEKVRYSELDADRFLMMLETETEKLSAPATKPSIQTEQYVQARDIIRMTPHPWKRFVARMLDEQLLNLIVAAAFMLGCSTLMEGIFWNLVTWALLMGMTVVLEPLCISLWATTPVNGFSGFVSIMKMDGDLPIRKPRGVPLKYCIRGCAGTCRS